MTDLLVKSAVKEQFEVMIVAAECNDAFDEGVPDLLGDAAWRAEPNELKTVQSRDLSGSSEH